MGFIEFTHEIFLLFLITAAKGSNEFKRCYNTSSETHCFEVQYDDTNSQLLTSSVYDARRRCSSRGATLVVIKNEQINVLFQQFKNESGNPVSNYNIWTDALRIENAYTWHWVNRELPTIQTWDVSYTSDVTTYVALLELRESNGKWQYYLTAKHPEEYKNYTCEYDESKCSSGVNNSKISDGRCYIAYSERGTWYEARNRCLMKGGDLASFKNVTSFNFSSLLDFTPQDYPLRAYWIGLRFTWYIWKESGTEIGYLNWMANNDQTASCLIVYFDCANGCKLTPYSCDNRGNVYIVCRTVASLPTTTTEAYTSTMHLTTTPSMAENITSGITVKLPNKSPVNSTSPQIVSLAVGIGVGVGVPVIIAIIVIVICVVRRKTLSVLHSSPSAVHAASDPSEIFRTPDGKEKESYHVEVPTYSTVNLSSASKNAAEVDQKTSTRQETNYAALNFL